MEWFSGMETALVTRQVDLCWGMHCGSTTVVFFWISQLLLIQLPECNRKAIGQSKLLRAYCTSSDSPALATYMLLGQIPIIGIGL